MNLEKFDYKAQNGMVKVLNAGQIQHRAKQVKQNTTSSRIKGRMTRLIHQTQKNPHLHRVASVWNQGKNSDFEHDKPGKSYLNYIDPSTPFMENAQSSETLLAEKGNAMAKFAKKWNKLNPKAKIINSAQAGIPYDSNRNNQYPQVNNQNFKHEVAVSGNKYFDGMKTTVNYVTHNHPNTSGINKALSGLKHDLHGANQDMKYTVYKARLQSAHRYAKRHHQTVKDAYSFKYGIGNNLVAGPQDSYISPLEDGANKYKQAKKFIQHVDQQSSGISKTAQLHTEPSKSFQSRKHPSFTENHLHVQGVGFGSKQKDQQVSHQVKHHIMDGFIPKPSFRSHQHHFSQKAKEQDRKKLDLQKKLSKSTLQRMHHKGFQI